MFKLIARNKDLLFISTFGLIMGVAALSNILNLSPVIGVFLLGISLASLPYKLEIMDKVEPVKDFGLVLFFLLLGYKLNFSVLSISFIPPILIIVIFNLIGIPLVMLFLGYVNRVKLQPTLMLSGIVNQISEFSLILATICYNTGIFNQRTFFILIISSIISILLSALAQNFLSSILPFIQKMRSPLSKNKPIPIETKFKLENHIVLIAHNEISQNLLTHFVNTDEKVLLIDMNPDVKQKVETKYSNVECLYLDIFDPDTRSAAAFNKAKLIISCLTQAQPAELAILSWLKEHNANVPFIAATDSPIDAIELYKANAAYVLQTKELASQHMKKLIDDVGKDYNSFYDYGKLHMKSLINQS